MKSALVLFFFILYWPCNLVMAKEKPGIEIVHDPFLGFYPYLGKSICRKKAFEIIFDKTIDNNNKIELWKKQKKTCSAEGSYQLILADMYMSYGGHYDEAKQILETTIDSTIYDTMYHKSMLFGAYCGLNEKTKAIDLAKKIINDYPNWAGGYGNLGIYFMNSNDWGNAKQYLEKALAMGAQDSAIYLSLAYVSYELREDDKVLGYYKKAFLVGPPHLPYLHLESSAAAVIVYTNKGKFKAAKDILEHQQELNPDIIKSRRFIGIKQYYENALKKANKHE